MGFYKATRRYRSDLWPEPIEAGNILQLTDEQAAMLNGDSPGVVEPIELVEKKDEPKPKAEPEPEARAVDEAPKTTARRGPGRKRARTVSEDSED